MIIFIHLSKCLCISPKFKRRWSLFYVRTRNLEKVLEVAESEISKSTFNTFLKDTELKEIRDNVAIIFVIHEFYAEWLNSNYKEVIQTIMKDVIGYEVEPKFFTAEQLAELDETSRKSNTPSEPQRQIIEYGHEGTDQFNTHNTFDTFVIGPGNRFPHAASLAVAEAPAQAYNPLFIYGGVGLGKTHLMHAIGHHVLSNQPNAKVLYTSSEKFTNDFIKSIRNNEPEAFREKYRNIDVLLIDDIQFIQNKEQTQEEFFHTFNELHQNKKQIVISSDRPPKEIAKLEDRLRSRFEWGLIVDITPPDYETRMAILQKNRRREFRNSC